MKAQNKNLTFKKISMVELNDSQMYSVEGGISPSTITTTIILYTMHRSLIKF